MLKNLFIITLLICNVLAHSQEIAKGYVYEDANKNGKRDRREAGIHNVAVSNGRDIVLTDSKGYYSIQVEEGNTLFVIKPSGYQTPLDENYILRFYYHYYPKGSPETFKYKGISPTGKLPKSIDFALYKQDEPENFTAIVFGDPQPYSVEQLDYFTEKIVNEVKKTDKTILGISMGDIAGDDLDLHPIYKERMRRLELPWYNVMGNHDMNYDAPSDELSDVTFRRNFGSANYAFNYANVHFIILDNIIYPDPRDGKGYWAGYREDQLTFLENNLKLVPKDKLVILAQHIDLKDNTGNAYRQKDRQQIFDLLKDFENVLVMSAHTHYQDQNEYTEEDGWKGKKPLHEYNVGTTSGDWYSGKIDEKGFPDATMRDGTPQGYAFLNINGNKYDVDYKVAGKESTYQMNIYAPKVVPHEGKSSSQIMVNFFMGSKNDVVEYRIGNSKWKKMRHISAPDLNYLAKVMEWDFTETLLPGRRPSNPVNSSHLWVAPIQTNLPVGTHTIEVRATDRYGKTHTGKKTYRVAE